MDLDAVARTDRRPDGGDIATDRGVFGISVAAELAGVPMQSLRLFEARGLIEPERTERGTRRYSSDDVGRARYINQLQTEGLNLAGIGAVLTLQNRNQVLAAENAALQAEIARLRQSQSARPPQARARHQQERPSEH